MSKAQREQISFALSRKSLPIVVDARRRLTPVFAGYARA